MRVKIIHHQADPGCLRIAFLEHPLDEPGPMLRCASSGNLDVASPDKRFYFDNLLRRNAG
jgi:hypothetical protein